MWRRTLFLAFLCFPKPATSVGADAYLSAGRATDPTAKTLSEIRAAEKRRIPLEVQLKASGRYPIGGPVEVTIILTNLFEAPLLMNSRMLVNHPLLQGEVSFRIVGPRGKKMEIQRLITPLSLKDGDFVTLGRGQSIQREVDLSDLFAVRQKGVYTIQVSYHNEVDHSVGAAHAWKGIIWSDPVAIQLN